ncbi:MAG: glycosyltransferase family 4 protein [Planctomycetota bacterium]|nr:glycosyltransferase family 4 protein [Planctomycetota bacterium]
MKLGVLLDRLDGTAGGAEVHTRALVTRCVEGGGAAAIATLSGDAPAGVETLRIEARGGRPERDEAFAIEGERALRAAGCDVVLAVRHALACDVYLPHGGLVDLARDMKDRAVGGPSRWTRVARAFSRKHAFFQRAEAALLAGRDGPLVIAVSAWIAGKLRAAYPACAPRLRTVLNGVDCEHFERAPHLAAGTRLRAELGLEAPLVGLLVAHHPQLKGAETAVRALAEPAVRDLSRPFVLLVAGGPLPRRLRALARSLGVADRVREVGLQADPRPLYAAVDLLVHPTWYDPCSLVCLEALAMGLPIITTPNNGAREVLGQRGGIVVEEPGNPSALATAIRVLADDELRSFTSDDARYVALKNRESTRLDRVLEICREAAGSASGGG